MEKCYTVAETVKMTGVKSYVLRYWEDELDLHIGRNELGHRYYTGDDIQLFLNIKELKNRGLQLRAIHDLLPKIARRDMPGSQDEETVSKIRLLEGSLPEEKEGPEDEIFKEELRESVRDVQEDTKILEFQEIMERLITQELHAKQEGEDRWRLLDEAIRRQQSARKEAAAVLDKKGKKKIKNHR